MALKDVFKRKAPEVVLDTYDTMIDCRQCEHSPDISSTVCLRCCQEKLSDHDFDTIVFRSAEDVQFRGDAAKIVRRLMTIIPDSCGTLRDEKRCKDCALSKHSMAEMLWSDLTVEGVGSAMQRIDAIVVDCKTFEQCRDSVKASLDVMHEDMSSLKDEILFVANRIVGV